MSDKPRLIKALRIRLNLTNDLMTDEILLLSTKNTSVRAFVELGLALEDLKTAFKKDNERVKNDLRMFFLKIRKYITKK